MMTLRPSAARGYADHGWLKSFHSFSFAGYYDPEHMGFGNLRVINEDRIEPGRGFATHGHKDMEIISYVLSGELAHKDDMTAPHTPAASAPQGGASVLGRPGDRRAMSKAQVIRPGDVQRMSAGTGVQHSEFNHAEGQTTHFLQIWIEPNVTGIAPSYEQKTFVDTEKRGQLRLVASNDGAQGSVTIHADAKIYAGLLDGDETATLALRPNRKTYVHLVKGDLEVNGQKLAPGDAAMIEAQSSLELGKGRDAEVLVFDLAA